MARTKMLFKKSMQGASKKKREEWLLKCETQRQELQNNKDNKKKITDEILQLKKRIQYLENLLKLCQQ
jgi:hypothetical protein